MVCLLISLKTKSPFFSLHIEFVSKIFPHYFSFKMFSSLSIIFFVNYFITTVKGITNIISNSPKRRFLLKLYACEKVQKCIWLAILICYNQMSSQGIAYCNNLVSTANPVYNNQPRALLTESIKISK